MKMNSNTILITGGSSGIGQGLAEAFHKLGNKIVVAGRRESALQEICSANPGMRYFVMDVADPTSIRFATSRILREFPSLNCVFNNAGVQHTYNFASGQGIDVSALVAEINTNLLGAIVLASEMVPHLKQQKDAVLLNVSSGLAFVPLARFPMYCATKAALHSFTISLRHQLKESGIKVIELIPPYVATNLGGPGKQVSPHAPQPMPLHTFVSRAMNELATDADEIAIGDAKGLAAANQESVKKVFSGMNR
jgi:uncharacterized oxidoreductase